MVNRAYMFKDINASYDMGKFNQSKQLTEEYLGFESSRESQLYVYKSTLLKERKKSRSEIEELTSEIEELKGEIRKIGERLDYFENNTINIDGYREITDDEAEVEIEAFLRELRDEGAPNFSILDIVACLNLPPEQIDIAIENMRRRKTSG